MGANNVSRQDFMQLLIQLKNNQLDGERVTDGVALNMNQITAQAFIFFFAGFDTSSTTLHFVYMDRQKQRN